jgi:hypothetical protein
MRKGSGPAVAMVLGLCCALALGAQQNTATNPPAVTPAVIKLEYPDSTSGLEHLTKDMMKAQKDGDAARADLLLRSLVLPQPREWYERVFGPTIAGNEEALYARAAAAVPVKMAEELHNAAELKPDGVEAQRFDRSCDDNAG